MALRLIVLLYSSFSCALAGASLAQPGDGPYYRLLGNRTLYIYDEMARADVAQIAAYLDSIRINYDQSYDWKLDEREDLILLSPAQQISNAFATISPNVKSVWYPSGAAMLDSFAESSWALTLAAHETAHLYQLNAKGPFNASLKTFFGNEAVINPLFWWIFIHPNVLTPTFLIEGNAVLNESRANMGGRLFSGEVRALVLAQIAASEIDAARLINNEFLFPYGRTAYFQGGYFQAHLAAKYGVDKTNQFFVAQGDHYLFPLILNDTFRDHFGASYAQEIREYLREWEGLAKSQKASLGQVVSASPFISPLNHDDQHIFFLRGDGLKPPDLVTVDKATGAVTASSIDLPLGKVFWDGDKPLAVSSEQYDLHHRGYSLYGEDHALDPRYLSQIVNDQRAGHSVALDAMNSWLEAHVLLDGEPYDIAASLPILDAKGNVYYFRQHGAERLLYRNRLLVFKYEGFYGKLMEVGADGAIYFIANTDSGSTLYRYQAQMLTRMLASDRVVDARQLNDGRFLVVEVNSLGHNAVLSEAEPRPAQPAVYSYAFASYHLVPQKISDPEQVRQDEKPYNALSNMRYSSLGFTVRGDGYDGLGFNVDASFNDPLQYQSLNLVASGSQVGRQNYMAQITFSKYLPNFFARYLYERSIWHQENLAGPQSFNSQAAAGFLLPFWKWQHWSGSWLLTALYDKNESQWDPFRPAVNVPAQWDGESYAVLNSLTVQFTQNAEPALSFYPWRSFSLNFQNKLSTWPGHWLRKENTSLVQSLIRQGFPKQFYGSLSGQVAWSENNDIHVNYDPQPLVIDIRIPRLTPEHPYFVQTASAARFEFSKVFDARAYSPRLPLGLDRLAPFVVAQGMFFDGNGATQGGYPTNVFEWGYGVDFQLLFAHLAPAKLRIMKAFNTTNPPPVGTTQVEFSTRYDF